MEHWSKKENAWAVLTIRCFADLCEYFIADQDDQGNYFENST